MKYILVYLLLTGFSYANTSLDQEYANIENKFAIKETELLQWFSNSVEGINHNSQNKIKLTYDKISDEKDRKEELKLQKSKINIENEQNIFLKKSDLRGLNRENQRIDIYYNRYPNEFAIVCRGIIKDGKITINGNKEPIVLVTSSSFEFLSSGEALYTYVTGPLFKDQRFEKEYPERRNVIFQNKLILKKTDEKFIFYMNDEIAFKINRSNGEVWGGTRKKNLFASNECYEGNRFAIELKMDRYKELFNLQEGIVDSINQELRHKVERSIDKLNIEITNSDRMIEELEDEIPYLFDENDQKIKKLEISYEKKLDELEKNKDQEKYNAWYNSPEQVAKRENELIEELNQIDVSNKNKKSTSKFNNPCGITKTFWNMCYSIINNSSTLAPEKCYVCIFDHKIRSYSYEERKKAYESLPN